MKILKAKRGISTIIAVLLMIVIAVAAAVITYVWIIGYIGGTMAGVEQQTEKMQISIDAVSGNTTELTVVVRNIGEITATVDQVYVDGASQTFTTDPTNIPVGETSTLTLTSFVGTPGTQYTIKVVCTDGQSATASWTCPPA